MKRDARIAYLEKATIQTDIELNKVVEEIKELSAKLDSLIDKSDQLTKVEELRLKIIEEQDLPDLRKRENRLAAHIENTMKELITLKAVPPTVQSEAGISYPILYHTILYYTILYYTMLYCTFVYCTFLYYTILYYTILSYLFIYLFIYLFFLQFIN
jgi:hypothetical protein